ncbi:MAG TPA: tetratricopeptide repeat protein [Streptosporangiaceae bacterium]|nr:tetratricopeptide repeat protein [Streptosporangiaceae bacterium]
MKQPRDFSLSGAIDLGARQAAAQRRQRTAEQGSVPASEPAAQSGLIIDVTDETFNTEVVARSRTVPVVLDLWADWCGPCKQLGPILEKLALEADGGFVLARVDVDANPQLSAALQVQSIPMVVAVVAGQVADGFLGALPEAQVREWLGQVMRVAEQLGLGPGASAGPSPDGQSATGNGQAQGFAAGPADTGPGAIFAEAQEAMERGDLDAAAAAFEKVLDASPADPVATMGLGQIGLIRRVESYDQAAARGDADARPDDARAQARVADIELALGQIEAAFQRLLDTIKRTSGDERDEARKHLVSLFEIFPPRDPRVTKARSALSSLLF